MGDGSPNGGGGWGGGRAIILFGNFSEIKKNVLRWKEDGTPHMFPISINGCIDFFQLRTR